MGTNRLFFIPIVAVVLFAAAIGWLGYRHLRPPAPDAAPETPSLAGRKSPGDATPAATANREVPAPPAAPPASASSPADTASPVLPSFDVVRVEPDGESVIAGRANPGASVELVANGRVVATTLADPSGLFALVPDALPPGSHAIVLQTRAPDGGRLQSAQSVTVVVAANRKDPPLVTVAAPGQPSVVLSRPDGPDPVRAGTAADAAASPPPNGTTPDGRADARIATVETEGSGRLFVSGQAAPSATVRLYLNDTFIAPGSAGADGRIAFSIGKGVLPGTYQVRLDDVDPVSGQVRSRAEVAFTVPAGRGTSDERSVAVAGAGKLPGSEGTPSPNASGAGGDPVVVSVPEVNTAIVSRGESLWAISKRIYGQGLRYTVIFGANSRQIRDPNRIYPGQVFVVPGQTGAAAPPATGG